MSDSTLTILVSSGQAVILAILAAMVKIWSAKQDTNHVQTTQNIEVLKEQTNGKLRELTDAVRGQASAEGNLAGRAAVRQENKEDAKQ